MIFDELTKVIKKEATNFNVETFINKDELFEYLSNKFKMAGVIKNKEKFIKALYERENQGSTYMGKLIAIPHGKSSTVNIPAIGFCKCNKPFEYVSHEEKGLVKFVFMFAITNETEKNSYLKILALLAGLLAKEVFIKELDLCENYEDLINLISSYDKKKG
ncbi:MAG: PTS sugar transporter subunit IIA [Bacillota bacterium]|nr:PTS sugar transporter subunit IIA [Bacillota bacterium]